MQAEQVLFSLTLERLEPIFKKWFNDVLTSQVPATPTPPPVKPERIRIVGDKALAKRLDCSVMTVQSLRRSKAIPYGRTGRKVFYFSDLVDEALSVQARKFTRKSTQL